MAFRARPAPCARLLGQALRRGGDPRAARSYSTAPAAAQPAAAPPADAPPADAQPPAMAMLKGDLKSAMVNKDAPRLAVLRAIMAAKLNASKTANPVTTDAQLVGLMRKISQTIADAAAEARAAGRQDLVDKETVQLDILDAYLGRVGVEALGEAELGPLVAEAVAAARGAGTAAKSLMGDVMRRLAGALEGKDVDMRLVARLVKEMTGKR